MNAILSAVATTADEVRRLRAELEVVEQRLRVLRRAAGLPTPPTPAPEPSAPPMAQATRLRSDDAKDWLQMALAASPLPAREIRQRAATAGLSWRTLQRAGRLLGVEMRRHGFAATAHSTWALPPEGGFRD